MKKIFFAMMLLPVFCCGQDIKIDSGFILNRPGTFYLRNQTFSDFRPNSSVVIFQGKDTVAYKLHKDSFWVFINPDKTRIALDSAFFRNQKRNR